MKLKITPILFLLVCQWAFAQVGVNTTTPNAQLDIRSSNQATPANTDGIIIPKIDAFPAVNPTAAQQGMLVYLTTTVASNSPGFYYWNNATTAWIPIGNNNNSGWHLDGNSIVGTDFIGTTNNQDINFKRNNTEAGFIGAVQNAFGVEALSNVTTGSSNSAFGLRALKATTTGNSNNAFGKDALALNTTGNFNAAFGDFSLNKNTASNNTAFGYIGLADNTSGSANTAIGSASLRSNTTGSNNVAIGFRSAFQNTSSSNTTAIGTEALHDNTASATTAIGYRALFKNTTGTNNTAIGAGSLQENNIGIGNTAIGFGTLSLNTSANGNTAVGDRALGNNTVGINNTGIGIGALFENTTGNYNTSLGSLSLHLNSTGTNNTSIGALSLYTNTTGTDNTVIGYGALQSATTASFNTAVGSGALENNTTGNNNVAVGYAALKANTTGATNTALGYNALEDNTTGIRNTAVGTSALPSNTTGSRNIAMGNLALRLNSSGGNNTALGDQSLFSNTIGSNNIAIGVNTAILSSTGSNNTAIGTSAFATNTTGFNNTVLGYNSDTSSATLFNATAIGAFAEVAANNSMVLGSINGVNGATTTVNVGIGTTTPQERLHVAGNIRMVDGNEATGKTLISDANGTASWQDMNNQAWTLTGNSGTDNTTNFIGTTDLTSFSLRTNNEERIKLNALGNVGIGTFGSSANPLNKLHVVDNSDSTLVGQLLLEQKGTADAFMTLKNNSRLFSLGIDTSADSFKISTAGSFPSSLTSGTLMTLLTTGAVGIGTTSPEQKLHVSGPAGLTAIKITNTSTSGSTSNVALDFQRGGTANTDWRIYNIGPNLTLANSGDDLTTVNDLYQFQGSRIIPMNDGTQSLGQLSANRWNTLFATNGTINTSDRREKKEIQPLAYGLQQLMQLKPVTFRWNNSQIDNNSKHLGFIAQDLQAVIPEVVVDAEWIEEEGKGQIWQKTTRLGVNYSEVIPVLVKSIQEQQTLLEKQNQEIEFLKKQNESMMQLLAALKAKVDKE